MSCGQVPRALPCSSIPNSPLPSGLSHLLQAAASAIGQQIDVLYVGSDREIETAFTTLAQRGAGRCLGHWRVHVLATGSVVALAARYRIPAIYLLRDYVAAGGLMSYGASIDRCISSSRHLCRTHPQRREAGRSASELPTKFELVINSRPLRRSASKFRTDCSRSLTR